MTSVESSVDEKIKPNYEHVQSVQEEFGKAEKKYTNDCGFDEITLIRRDLEMKQLIEAYPNMCTSWLELAWNFCEYTPKEEQDAIIREKKWEGKPTKERNLGGIIHDAIAVKTNEGMDSDLRPGDTLVIPKKDSAVRSEDSLSSSECVNEMLDRLPPDSATDVGSIPELLETITP